MVISFIRTTLFYMYFFYLVKLTFFKSSLKFDLLKLRYTRYIICLNAMHDLRNKKTLLTLLIQNLEFNLSANSFLSVPFNLCSYHFVRIITPIFKLFTFPNFSFSTIKAYNVFLGQIDLIARDHEIVAEGLQEKVAERLKSVQKETTNNRKNVII